MSAAGVTTGAVVVVGMGEIGTPLFQLVEGCCDAVAVDVDRVDVDGPCAVLHICIPFAIDDFIGECARYVDRYCPAVTVINSTVAVGTTRRIAEATGRATVNSPVRGKHIRMRQDLLRYVKYIGSTEIAAAERAAAHFEMIGITTRILSSPEATELAKLTETTYFGLLIAWAQEVERYCEQFGIDYDDVVSFYEEIDFFPPVRYFPGIIGGHCVLPNIAILRGQISSGLLDAIERSNEMKKNTIAEMQNHV